MVWCEPPSILIYRATEIRTATSPSCSKFKEDAWVRILRRGDAEYLVKISHLMILHDDEQSVAGVFDDEGETDAYLYNYSVMCMLLSSQRLRALVQFIINLALERQLRVGGKIAASPLLLLHRHQGHWMLEHEIYVRSWNMHAHANTPGVTY